MVFIITVNSNIVFTKQPTAERYLPNLFFTNNFVNFQKILAAHQKNVPKTFSKLTKKKTPVAKSYFSKVAGFCRSIHLQSSVKNGVLRKVFAKFTGKHLHQRFFFWCKKETLAQVFFCEFCEIYKNTCFYRAPPDNYFCFQLFPATLLKQALPTVF